MVLVRVEDNLSESHHPVSTHYLLILFMKERYVSPSNLTGLLLRFPILCSSELHVIG